MTRLVKLEGLERATRALLAEIRALRRRPATDETGLRRALYGLQMAVDAWERLDEPEVDQ